MGTPIRFSEPMLFLNSWSDGLSGNVKVSAHGSAYPEWWLSKHGNVREGKYSAAMYRCGHCDFTNRDASDFVGQNANTFLYLMQGFWDVHI